MTKEIPGCADIIPFHIRPGMNEAIAISHVHNRAANPCDPDGEIVKAKVVAGGYAFPVHISFINGLPPQSETHISKNMIGHFMDVMYLVWV